MSFTAVITANSPEPRASDALRLAIIFPRSKHVGADALVHPAGQQPGSLFGPNQKTMRALLARTRRPGLRVFGERQDTAAGELRFLLGKSAIFNLQSEAWPRSLILSCFRFLKPSSPFIWKVRSIPRL